MRDHRKKQLALWAGQTLSAPTPQLETVSGDASFRRYFRFSLDSQSIIAVDAPPKTENNQAFYAIGKLLKNWQLHVPHFLHYDFEKGFLLLSDLGNSLYLPALNHDTVDFYYTKAIEAMITMQKIPATDITNLSDYNLPHYDHSLLHAELDLFNQWFLKQHLNLLLSTEEKNIITDVFTQLISSAKQQQQVLVHRDFHSRNLMICQQNTPGIIDFQDAVIGPISYDLVSLLKDCYIEWPETQVKQWADAYHQKALANGLLTNSFNDFFRDFEWMGMQRHIKVLGIFSRLFYRDHKSQYLNDIPLTFKYLLNAAEKYPQFTEFYKLLSQRIQPAMATKQ